MQEASSETLLDGKHSAPAEFEPLYAMLEQLAADAERF
jgi:hypothetical protein